MAPYSLDLRQKIVATYEAGNTSIRKVQSIEGLSSTVTTLSKPIFEEILF
jgi:transposase